MVSRVPPDYDANLLHLRLHSSLCVFVCFLCIPLYRQRKRSGVRAGLLRGKVLCVFDGPLHVAGLERETRACSVLEIGRSSELEPLQLCVEQSAFKNRSDGHEVDLGNSDKKLRDQAQARILSNVNKNERGLFTTSTDKNGTTKLVLNKDAAANFDGKHSAAYGMLNQAINAKAVATVTVGDVQTVGTTTYHVQDAGGGKTVPTGNGNVSILLSEHPDPLISQGILPLRGMNGEVVPNPPGIIAGHELLGHGRLEMLGRPYGEGEAIGVENQLRREQGLPLRNPQDY